MRAKGSLTVEAAWIVSICLIIMGLCITISIRMYGDALSYIEETVPKEIDPVDRFRLYHMGKEVFSIVLGD